MPAQAQRGGNGGILGTGAGPAHDLGPLHHLPRPGAGADHLVQAGTFVIS
jgi:hypothetical protein